MTPLFTVDCTCGRRVVIDSDTMRKVEDGQYRFVPAPKNDNPARFDVTVTGIETRRVSLVDEYTLGDWDGGSAA